MIIVSQDKKRILNFENIIDIWVEEKGTICFTPVVNINGIDILGYYKTEERAKEVIEKIIKQYENSMWKLSRTTISFCEEFVYRMPEE